MTEAQIELTTRIASAFVSNNSLHAAEIGELLKAVHSKIIELEEGPVMVKEAPEKPKPIMPWKKTITDEAIISLEDGKPYKTLKRHLTGLGLTPDDYRKKWGLPQDYPLVCKNYAARRAEIARSIGLGRKVSAEPETVSAPEPVLEAPKKTSTKTTKTITPHPKPKDRHKKPYDADNDFRDDQEAAAEAQDAA